MMFRDTAIRMVVGVPCRILNEKRVFDANGQEIEVDEFAVEAKIAELQAAEPMRQLRIKRTAILAESDWMANSDVTMSDAWRDYRQALRDLPANSPNVALDEQGNLINVTWPTKPE